MTEVERVALGRLQTAWRRSVGEIRELLDRWSAMAHFVRRCVVTDSVLVSNFHLIAVPYLSHWRRVKGEKTILTSVI